MAHSEGARTDVAPGGQEPKRPSKADSGRSDPVAVLARRLDAFLRYRYGILEFSEEPTCILRLSRERAGRRLSLSDGTTISRGEPVGELHFWSEHMPTFVRYGPDLAWAVETYRRLKLSFGLLAAALDSDQMWRDLRAVFARWAFAGTFDASHQRRLIEGFGLEIFPPDGTISGRLHDLMQDFLLWGLLRAFNPGALNSHGFFRSRQELWVSRPGLLARFSPELAPCPAAGRGLAPCTPPRPAY
ncbi:MAG: YkoP family protein [Acetobacteraceae bacterium]